MAHRAVFLSAGHWFFLRHPEKHIFLQPEYITFLMRHSNAVGRFSETGLWSVRVLYAKGKRFRYLHFLFSPLKRRNSFFSSQLTARWHLIWTVYVSPVYGRYKQAEQRRIQENYETGGLLRKNKGLAVETKSPASFWGPKQRRIIPTAADASHHESDVFRLQKDVFLLWFQDDVKIISELLPPKKNPQPQLKKLVKLQLFEVGGLRILTKIPSLKTRQKCRL